MMISSLISHTQTYTQENIKENSTILMLTHMIETKVGDDEKYNDRLRFNGGGERREICKRNEVKKSDGKKRKRVKMYNKKN